MLAFLEKSGLMVERARLFLLSHPILYNDKKKIV